ncbi:hypothetical protein Aperf_G00000058077 [Anoplocephala perfoliata]
MTDVGDTSGDDGGSGVGGSMLPAHLLERLEARDAQRKAAAASSETARARRRGDAIGEHILLPPLNLPPPGEGEEEMEPIFESLACNTPSFFLENMARAKALLLRRFVLLEEKCHLTEGAPGPVERTKILDDLLDQIEELQRWFSESSPHLKSFHVEQARQDIDEIKARFQEVRASVTPKKRFKFGVGAKASTKPTVPSAKVTTSVEKTVTSLLSPGLFKFSLSGLSNRHDLRLPTEIDEKADKDCLRDQSLCLVDLTNCQVRITLSCGNLMASKLTKCVIKIQQPVVSSIMLQDCVDCRFVLACRQLRVHRTRGSRFDVFVASAPIIEDSSDLLVGPWNGGARFSEVLGTTNHWNEVQDFSCPTLVAEKAAESPNWSLLPEQDWLKDGEEM